MVEEVSTVGAKDENQDRGNWDRKADYILSCVGYAVGLGNVWRFPYLAFENGGAAFLIPYVIMLVFAGIPVFFMECALGQFTSLGPISAFKFSPILKGVGLCMVVLNVFVSIYYNVIITYTVFYFFASLQNVLPWTNCGNFWNSDWDVNGTQECSTEFVPSCNVYLNSRNTSSSFPNVTLYLDDNRLRYNPTANLTVETGQAEEIAAILGVGRDELGCDNNSTFTARGTSASEEFWENYVLQRSEGIHDTGGIVTGLGLSLMLAWIVIYFSMIRGIKSSGKVVYFTAVFPYVVLLVFMIRGATLDGAYDGVQYYIGNKSDWSKLYEAEVWKAAATQIFFSLSAAWGGLIALSSYNKFHNNCFFDSIFVCLVNCATSLFAGFAIFTVVGHMAKNLGKEVDEVVQSGFSLAFVAYPEAITKLPAAPLWAILFFLMLFTLGLDSQFTGIESILTCATDSFPKQFRDKRNILTLSLIIILFMLGLPCVTNAGVYWLNLIDHYAAGWGLIFMAVLELVGIAWIYGANNFIKDIEMMIGEKSWVFWLYWRICWYFISPLLLLAVLIWSLATFKPPDYAGVEYPGWANAIGWLTIVTGLIFIPIMAIVAVVKNNGDFFQACRPAADWGPYLKEFRGDRYAHQKEPEEAIALHGESGSNEVPMTGKENPVYQSTGEEELTKI